MIRKRIHEKHKIFLKKSLNPNDFADMSKLSQSFWIVTPGLWTKFWQFLSMKHFKQILILCSFYVSSDALWLRLA